MSVTTIELGDVVDVAKGISYRSSDYTDADGGLPFINLKCVGRGGGFRYDGIKYYAGTPKADQYVDPGDILIANTDLTQNREVIGSPIVIPDIGGVSCFSLDLSKLKIKRPDMVDGRWLFYYLKSAKARSYMISHSNGSTVSHLNTKSVPKMGIDLPDMVTQRRIADILGSLDDKIELNRQMNETLEQIGQALFRHYFIDNPDAKNWPDVKFGDLVCPRRGKSLTSKLMRPGVVPVVSGGLSPAGHHDEANTVAPVITISASGVNAGYVALWGDNVWSADSSFIDSTMTDCIYYLYYVLESRQKEIYDSQTGSGQPHIYPSHIERLDIKKAPDRLLELFCERASTMFGTIWDNECENEYLIELRDALLRELIQ